MKIAYFILLLVLGFGMNTCLRAEPNNDFNFAQMRLLVCDYQVMEHFYEKILQLPVKFRGVNYIEFETAPGATIGVFAKADMPGVHQNCPRTKRDNETVLVIRVGSVDDASKFLQSQDIDMVLPPQDRKDWGVRTAHFRDPEGNLIELLSSLSGA